MKKIISILLLTIFFIPYIVEAKGVSSRGSFSSSRSSYSSSRSSYSSSSSRNYNSSSSYKSYNSSSRKEISTPKVIPSSSASINNRKEENRKKDIRAQQEANKRKNNTIAEQKKKIEEQEKRIKDLEKSNPKEFQSLYTSKYNTIYSKYTPTQISYYENRYRSQFGFGDAILTSVGTYLFMDWLLSDDGQNVAQASLNEANSYTGTGISITPEPEVNIDNKVEEIEGNFFTNIITKIKLFFSNLF